MAKVAFQSPGMTVAEIETQIAAAMGWDVADPASLAKIDHAITIAGQAACTWEGRDWWFLWNTGTFDTEAGVASYDLRTVNSGAMADIHAPRRVWQDIQCLGQVNYQGYLDTVRISGDSTGNPYAYALSGDLTIHLLPTPADAQTIGVDYLRRHSKITSAGSLDSALLVPGEFHYGIYVQAAVWLCRHEVVDIGALAQCPEFAATIHRMQAAEPTAYDDNCLGGAYPDDRTVIIYNDVEIP